MALVAILNRRVRPNSELKFWAHHFGCPIFSAGKVFPLERSTQGVYADFVWPVGSSILADAVT